MRIDKLHIQNFGQFHDKDITLNPGINVVYGANEAGKSTIKDFIVDMLYGIDKLGGDGTRIDHYEQRKPINGTLFSGAMQVSTEDDTYFIERNFLPNQKETRVRDLDSGEEISLQEPNSLIGTLLHTDKKTYMNTLCVSQEDIATNQDITDKLNNYIVNMASTKVGDINAVNAIAALKNKKKEFMNGELEKREQELTAKLSLNRDFNAELASLKEEYAKVEAQMATNKPDHLQFTPITSSNNEATEEEKKDDEKPKESLTTREKEINMLQNMGRKSILDNAFVILFIGLLVIALFVGVAYLIPVNISEVKIGIIGFGVLLVILTVIQIFMKRAHLYQLLEEIEIEQGFEEAKAADTVDINRQRELANRLSSLMAKEEAILKERKEQEAILMEINKIREKMESAKVDNQALDLAIRTIQDLSEEIYESFGSVLNEKVSEIVKRVTNNKYTEVKIDEKLHVMVKSGSSFISMDYLSTGTIEQIYLALRFSIANVLIAENLPIIMDDVFVNYDSQRLYEILTCLGEHMNRQIVIFTVNPRVQDMLIGLGIQSNFIEL